MTPDIEYDYRELSNTTGQTMLFSETASCTLCPWQMTTESSSALAHLDNIEEMELQALNHLEGHHG